MNFAYHGISYHNCPVELREKISLTTQQQQAMLDAIVNEKSVTEALVLNTCNRTEFYLCEKKGFDSDAFLTDLLSRINPASVEPWRLYHKNKAGIDVVRHIFTVACGLDSQMIGEYQIISQLKSAYRMANETQTSKFFFHRLIHSAFRVSKAVRTKTDISCGAVSISLAAVDLAKSKMSLAGACVMIVGAGENAALTAKYLLKAGVSTLFIANRNAESAKSLACQLKAGHVIAIHQIPVHLTTVDLVLCSTAATEPIITLENSVDILDKRQKPIIMIDIAVPRDIAFEVGRHPMVDLYNIDDLNMQIVKNKNKRDEQIPKALAIIEAHTAKFESWFDSLDVRKTISVLSQKYIDSARKEARRYSGDFVEADRLKLEKFAESLAKKMLHGPISYLKSLSDDPGQGTQSQTVELIIKMFLEETQKN